MKTFIIHVHERRIRAISVRKCIVVAESPEAAVELVKSYYGPNVKGWDSNAEFVVKSEVLPNTVKMMG